MLSSGTPCYMVPEVLLGKPYNKTIDYYALGIISYELLMGHKPYTGDSKSEIKQKIVDYQVQISDLPESYSQNLKELINSLIQRKLENRLGFGGFDEIKSHKFFENFNWEEVSQKKVVSPILPLIHFTNKTFKNEDFSKWERKGSTGDGKLDTIFKRFLYFDREALMEQVKRKQSQLSTEKTLNLNNVEKKEEIVKEAYAVKMNRQDSSNSNESKISHSNNIIIVEEASVKSPYEVSQGSARYSVNVSKISVHDHSAKVSIGSLKPSDSKNDSNSNYDSELSSIRKIKKKLTSRMSKKATSN